MPANRPQIMGILNLDPHSFFTESRHTNIDNAVVHAEKMVAEGADIIDIGAEATNVNLENPTTQLEQELERLIPVLERVRAVIDVPISVDTSKPEVMQAAIAAGADIINDVRALRLPGALKMAAQLNVPVILMHMQYPEGMPSDIKNDPYDGDVISYVKHFLQQRIDASLAAGISRENLTIDPGFGGRSFGKTTEQNVELVTRFHEFHELGYPVLAGVSRKSFIGDILNQDANERLYGSLALLFTLIKQGANILRVHDVIATVDVVKMLNHFK
tara:strand:- start:57981 stop:58799 length:819 start_codon:yes stop_codon:yes gene_type:complete